MTSVSSVVNYVQTVDKHFRADLHSHTTCSDGSLSPEELVHKAKEVGLSGLAITDHDTIDAFEIALPIAQKVGIELIPGVEFSAEHEGVGVHILGYSFIVQNSAIQNFCERHQQRRRERTRKILALLEKHHMSVTENEMDASERSPGRPHIAQAMVKKGYVKTLEEAFKKYLNRGKPCFVPSEAFSVLETIEVVHQAGGLAVLAHPHLMQSQKTINSLLNMDFDGIEVYYARFPRHVEEKWIRIAEKKGWLATGGSDFHGEAKPKLSLGCSWVAEEIFRKLQQHFLKNQ